MNGSRRWLMFIQSCTALCICFLSFVGRSRDSNFRTINPGNRWCLLMSSQHLLYAANLSTGCRCILASRGWEVGTSSWTRSGSMILEKSKWLSILLKAAFNSTNSVPNSSHSSSRSMSNSANFGKVNIPRRETYNSNPFERNDDALICVLFYN
jgi:hypothetical protein